MNLDITREVKQHSTILTLKGEVDVYTSPQLKHQLLPLVTENNQEVVVNLEQVEYMDSTGLGVFIGALKASKQSDAQLKLRNPQPRIERLFQITGLQDVMDIKQEEEA